MHTLETCLSLTGVIPRCDFSSESQLERVRHLVRTAHNQRPPGRTFLNMLVDAHRQHLARAGQPYLDDHLLDAALYDAEVQLTAEELLTWDPECYVQLEKLVVTALDGAPVMSAWASQPLAH